MQRAALEYLKKHPFANILANKIVEEALMYRIAKPPIQKSTKEYSCPTCDRIDISNYQYCPDCGQNIKW